MEPLETQLRAAVIFTFALGALIRKLTVTVSLTSWKNTYILLGKNKRV